MLSLLLVLLFSQSALAQGTAVTSTILEGSYIKIGMTDAGTIGSGGTTDPGMLYDPTGTSTFDSDYDYLTPGSPFFGWSLSYTNSGTETDLISNNVGYSVQVGTLVDYSGVEYDGTTKDNRAVYTYATSDLSITEDYSFDDDDTQIAVTITITATTDMEDVYYAAYTDPDVQAVSGDSSATNNTLADGDGYTLVYSESLASKYVLGFYSTDENANASVSGSWSDDPEDYYDGSDGYDSGLGDDTIGVGYYLGNLSAGETVTISYYIVFGTDIDSAIEEVEETVGPGTIDLSQETFSVDDLESGDVLPIFEGGTLAFTDSGELSTDFSIKEEGGTIENSQYVTLSGSLVGDGAMAKTGAGILELTSSDNDMLSMTVSEGTLMIASTGLLTTEDGVLVEVGGTLGGTGTVVGSVTVEGTLAPGNSPGTLTVAGSVTQTSSSVYEVEIDGTGTGSGAGNYDRLVLTGSSSIYTADGSLTLTLRGISGDANNDFSAVIGDAFVIVQAEGGVTGTYDSYTSTTDGLEENTHFQVAYGDDTVTVYVVTDSYADLIGTIGGTEAAELVGDIIDNDGTSSSVQDASDALLGLGASDVISVLESLSGYDYSASRSAARQGSHMVRDGIMGHAGTMIDTNSESALWMSSAGLKNEIDGDRISSGYFSSTGAVFGGVDLFASQDLSQIDALSGGLGVGYSSTTTNTDIGNRAVADSYYGFGYVNGRINDAFMTALVGLSYDEEHVDRKVALSGDTLEAKGDVEGFSVFADAEFGYNVELSKFMDWRQSFSKAYVRPIAGIKVEYTDRSAFTESGDETIALSSKAYSEISAQTKLGLQFGTNFLMEDGNEGNVALGAYWLHEVGEGQNPRLDLSWAGNSLPVSSTNIGDDRLQGKLELNFSITEKTHAYLDTSYELGENIQSGKIYGGVRFSW